MFLNQFGFIYGVCACFLWGLAPILMKFVVGADSAVSVTETVFWRFFFSAFLSFPWLSKLWRKRQYLFRYEMILPPVTLLLTFLIQVYALQKVPASLFVLVFGLTPLLSIFIDSKTRQAKSLFLLATSFVGIIIFSDIHVADLQIQSSGIIFLFLSLLGWMLSLWLMTKTPKEIASSEFTAYSQIVSVLLFLPVLLIQKPEATSFVVTKQLLEIFGISLILMTAMILFHQGMVRFPTVTILTQFLEPIFGVILAVVILNEKFGTNQLIGMIIISSSLLALFYQQVNKSKTR